MGNDLQTFTAFQGTRRIAAGRLQDIAPIVRGILESEGQTAILMFDDATGRQVDFDLAGQAGAAADDVDDVSVASAAAEQRGPGRPKLGVVAREVTLLPRHWEWLNSRPGGASVTLRRLVDAAKATAADHDRGGQAQEASDRFMSAMAGNFSGYEAVSRALYAADRDKFWTLSEHWPVDVRDHARLLAAPAFEATALR